MKYLHYAGVNVDAISWNGLFFELLGIAFIGGLKILKTEQQGTMKPLRSIFY